VLLFWVDLSCIEVSDTTGTYLLMGVGAGLVTTVPSNDVKENVEPFVYVLNDLGTRSILGIFTSRSKL